MLRERMRNGLDAARKQGRVGRSPPKTQDAPAAGDRASVKLHRVERAGTVPQPESKQAMSMQTNTGPGLGLGATARWTAGVRAKESTRADHLFNDPWAAALAGKEGFEWVERRSAADLAPIVLRTCFFDDVLSRIAFNGGIRQVVLLAAGLDTRAFRLDWPAQTRLFELDQPAVLKYKERILRSASAQPACVRRTLGVDLTKPWQPALIEKGFDPRQPSAWLLEGFLYYLSNERLRHLLGEVSRLAVANSWIAFDIMNSTVLTSVWCRRWVEMQDRSEAPWIGTMDDPEQLLATLGWKAHVTEAGQPGIHHGRWPYPVIPPRTPYVPHNWLVIAYME